MSIINRVFTAPNNDQYGHFSGPTCVIQLFYKSNLSILTLMISMVIFQVQRVLFNCFTRVI